ncbi:hypothetical protein [Bacillus pseudomycoides]|uniref:hypothetical protein n=1 Tax=Bacillus pseudomycoides TaxID=64104 RepID=UPI003CE7F65B
MRTDILTKKQRVLLELINKFGIITIQQTIEYLKGEISFKTIYTSKARLCDLQFIEEVKFGNHLILYIKEAGTVYLDSKLAGYSRISYTTLQHTLTTNDCLIATRRIYQERNIDCNFITERELRREYVDNHFPDGIVDFKKLRHVAQDFPDFVIEESDGSRTANEVELNAKSKARYEKKFKRYQMEIQKGVYKKVIYMVPNHYISNAVQKEGYVYLNATHLKILPIDKVIKK